MDRMRIHLTNMCTGWDVEQIKTIVNETLHDIVTPLVFAEAADLIASHKLCGRDVVVVSASGEEIGRADRARAGSHPRDGDPDGRRGRQVHRRDRRSTATAKARCRRSASWPRARATRSSTATPTPTRSPTCRCSRSSAIRAWSIPTARCAAKPPPATGRCWSFPAGVAARPHPGTVGSRGRHHRRGRDQRTGRRRADLLAAAPASSL